MISQILAYTGTDEDPGDYRTFLLQDYLIVPDSTGYLAEILETVGSAIGGKRKLDLNKLPPQGFSVNIPIDYFIEFWYEVTYKDGLVVETLNYREGVEEDEEVLSYNRKDGLKILTDNPDVVIDFLTDDLYDLLDTSLDLVIPRVMPKVFNGIIEVKKVVGKGEKKKGVLSKIMEKFTNNTSEVADILGLIEEVRKTLSDSMDCFLIASDLPRQLIDSDGEITEGLRKRGCRLILDRPKSDDNYVLLG